MKQRYYAFYWTLPVPWVGFTSLPAGIDAAARASRTIRYCREKVRAHVSTHGGVLVPGGEVAMMELAPDRGSPEVGAEFARLLARAEREGAHVAIVDFSGHNSWRGHQYLAAHYDHPACELVPVSPDDVHLAGFNPFDHFEAWRERTRAKSAGKADHRARIIAALEEIDGTSLAARAGALNDLGLQTHTGKAWTADNLRKFLAAG